MSRPQRCRRVCSEPRFRSFVPEGAKSKEEICLSTDEYEVLRLVDYERKTHEECAKQMDISRTTVTEIYDSARHKLSSALVNGCRLEISGGNYRICDGSASSCCGGVCRRDYEKLALSLTEAAKIKKCRDTLRIALPCDGETIFPHFGHTEFFRICDIKDGKEVLKSTVNNIGGGKGAIPQLLKKMQVDVLICGGIGANAVKMLESSGVRVYSGISGNAGEAVEAYLKGSLKNADGPVCTVRADNKDS